MILNTWTTVNLIKLIKDRNEPIGNYITYSTTFLKVPIVSRTIRVFMIIDLKLLHCIFRLTLFSLIFLWSITLKIQLFPGLSVFLLLLILNSSTAFSDWPYLVWSSFGVVYFDRYQFYSHLIHFHFLFMQYCFHFGGYLWVQILFWNSLYHLRCFL